MRDHGSRCGRRSCGFAAVEGIVGVADSRRSGGLLESAAEQAAAADRLSFSILLLGSSLGRPLSRAVRRLNGGQMADLSSLLLGHRLEDVVKHDHSWEFVFSD